MCGYKFVFVVDGEFATSASCGGDPLPAHCEALVACFRSNPVIVEVPEDHPNYAHIVEGWKWDGNDWIPPEGWVAPESEQPSEG